MLYFHFSNGYVMPFFKYLFYFLVFIGTPYFAFAQSTENIDYAKDVFDAVNEYRQDSGRALLEWSDAISGLINLLRCYE